MSPEQCLDHDLDGRTDCYSLGCVLYETLTGKPPLSARTAFETMNKHMSEMPQRLNQVRPDMQWSEGLQEILFKAMDKSPDKRYQTILELTHDLARLQKGAKPNFTVQASPATEIAESRSSDYFNEKLKEVEQDAKSLFWLKMLTLLVAEMFAFPLFMRLLSFDLTYILPFFLLLGMIIAPFKIYPAARNRLNQVIDNCAIVRRGEFAQIPILSVRKTFVQELSTGLMMQFDASETYPNLGNVRVFPASHLAPIWNTLCSASEFEGITQESKVFPIMAEVYFDAKQKPVAVVLRGHLAWVNS